MPETRKLRFLVCSDTHLGFDYPVRPRIQRRRRGFDFFNNFKRVLSHAIKERVDFVVHGGDLFFRSKIPQKVVDLTYQILYEFLEHGIPLYMVPGNHERSAFPESPLLSHSLMRVFDRPRTFMLDLPGIRVALSGFPFIRHNIRDRFPSLLKEAELEKETASVRLLCLHQAVEGARVGPKGFTFRYGKDVIAMKDIPGDFHAVLAGHIHRKQVLMKPPARTEAAVPILFPGSIERTSFAEMDEEKGFYEATFTLSDPDKRPPPHLKFMALPARPMRDLILDKHLQQEDLMDFFRSKLSCLEADSVVRIKGNGEISDRIRSALTSDFLRKVFPSTMNYQFSASFFRQRSEPQRK